MRISDPQTDVAPSNTRGRNVRSKNQCSMCPAIHTKSRSWLRSSSTREPSDPLLRVVFRVFPSSGISPFALCVRDGSEKSPLPSKGEAFEVENGLGPAVRWRTAETSELGFRDRGSLEAGGGVVCHPSSSLAPLTRHPLRPSPGGEQTPHQLPKLRSKSDGARTGAPSG